MEAVISSFNSLPRKETVPSGIAPNHWHFSMRHVPLDPPGDVVFILNPTVRFCHVEGPLKVAGPGTAQDEENRAIAKAFFLVKAFANGLGGIPGVKEPKKEVGRPWSWCTDTKEEAERIQRALKVLGVQGESLTVDVAPAEENKIADQEWEKFFTQLKGSVEGK
ncbi:MAG: hypothetical protein M1834_007265 [Cirrosporium novae-zelandiae]|nr:MAG: hypothetical protein M1834_007265 [Cirrosporium novae-zelandiae]